MNASSLLLVAALSAPQAEKLVSPDPPIECGMCEAWNRPHEPFQLFGNTYYVGTAGLSALLVTSDGGHVLLDGALSQSSALIDANIRKLGFRTEDIEVIVNSHAHFDHAAGIAALQRASGARVVTSPAGASALRDGMPAPDDPQASYGDGFPAVANVHAAGNGEAIRVGPLALTIHFTPGHTPGGTSWTWRSCQGDRCLDMVYADSLTAVSAPGYRFTDHPDVVEALRRSIGATAELSCDIMVSTHPEFSNVFEKLARRKAGEKDALIDPSACRAYADGAAQTLDKRLEKERAEAP